MTSYPSKLRYHPRKKEIIHLAKDRLVLSVLSVITLAILLAAYTVSYFSGFRPSILGATIAIAIGGLLGWIGTALVTIPLEVASLASLNGDPGKLEVSRRYRRVTTVSTLFLFASVSLTAGLLQIGCSSLEWRWPWCGGIPGALIISQFAFMAAQYLVMSAWYRKLPD